MKGRSPATEVGPAPPRGLFRSRLRDARIRSKLGLILIIPLVAVVALAAVRLVDSGQRAIAAELVRSVAAVSVEASGVSHQLHRERVEAAQLLFDPEREAGAFNIISARTDEAVDGYKAARAELGEVPEVVRDRLARIDEHLEDLEDIRQQILGDTPITASAAVLRYGVILSDVLTYQEAVREVADDPTLAEEIRAVAALSKAKTHAAEAEAVTLISLVDGQLSEEELTAFLATQTGQQEAFLAFGQTANPEQLAVTSEAITGGNVAFADRAAAAMLRSVGGELEISVQAAANSFSGMVNAIHWVEGEIQTDLLQSATELRDAVLRQVLVEAAAVLLSLIIAVTVAILLARMLARSLGQLRQSALSVADRELPDTVARLSDPRTLGENTPAQLAEQVREPIQLRSRDEIGQVAQAFNVVHRAAVRVAAEQAALRTSVSAMFLNLARRSQSLVDRMISQLDEIERNEDDPKRLSRMFALDNLATRMRRNDENLLILAGADSSPPRTGDALVTDALRAAQSEVEHYDRIEFGIVDDDVSIVAHAVNDVVRLVAELLDNATRFSPPDSSVVVEARRLGDQVIAQVEDRGVAMPQDQMHRINAWLAAPPVIEVTTFRKMGLAVVGRLAARHHIRVELRCDPAHGTVAYVALPSAILILPASRTRMAQIPAPRSPLTAEVAPPPPAAPPVPPRHLGQLPKRSAAVAHHAAGRGSRPNNAQSRSDLPVAGRPAPGITSPPTAGPPAASTPARASTPPPEATIELPIFREMEAVWFRSHEGLELGRTGATTSSATSYTPSSPTPPSVRPTAARGPAPEPASAAQSSGGPPGRNDGRTDDWQTVADEGWAAAEAAAEPQSGGATRSGLPKRVPKAQLVPGGVETSSGAKTQRRSPDEIRGLLSAYHRGVQRGRESGGR